MSNLELSQDGEMTAQRTALQNIIKSINKALLPRTRDTVVVSNKYVEELGEAAKERVSLEK
jgi:hypothetical protein